MPEAPELPARLLADPAMIAACQARDFSTIFRLMKTKAGIYPSRIARCCELTPSRVGEVMARKRSLRDIQVIERVADGLRIPGHMLGLAARPWEKPPPAPISISGPGEPFPRCPIAGSGGALPGSDLDSILAIATGNRASASTLRALRGSIEDYWRRDDQHGGEALRPAVTGQLRYVLELLRDARDDSHRRDLHGIGGELARLVGWTYFDARQYQQARRYFTEALRLAKAVDDYAFIANVLACMSLQATYEDKPNDALALVSAAQDSARRGEGSTPRVLSMLSMREAFAHAILGNRNGTYAAIGEAHRQFERITGTERDPAWVSYFDRTKLIVDTGIARGRLGEASAAEPLIAEALQREQNTNLRGRAFHAFWLATTQLERGELDLACHTAGQAVSLAAAVDSERVTGHIREFHDRLTPYRGEPVVQSFTAQLRQAIA